MCQNSFSTPIIEKMPENWADQWSKVWAFLAFVSTFCNSNLMTIFSINFVKILTYLQIYCKDDVLNFFISVISFLSCCGDLDSNAASVQNVTLIYNSDDKIVLIFTALALLVLGK